MNAQEKLVGLSKRRDEILKMGGRESVKKQKEAGKMTARERLMHLFDEGSFVEIGAFVKARPAPPGTEVKEAVAEGVITGYGTVDGRLSYAYAQDATALYGSLGEMQAKKIIRIIDMGIKTGAPVIAMLDSGGGRLNEGVDVLNGYSGIIAKTVEASGVIPQIAIVAGLASGASAMIAASSDFVLITKEGQLFLTPPVVLKEAKKENVTDVGNAFGAMKAGNAHVICSDDGEAITTAKKILSYLPSNNLDDAPYMPSDDAERLCPGLNTIADKGADPAMVLMDICDQGSFFPLQQGYGSKMLIGFARMNGKAVGIIANRGEIGRNGASKAARFITICDSFSIPVVTLVNTAGLVISKAEEMGGNIRALTKLSAAYASATTPKISVITKEAYGSPFIAMSMTSDLTYAWPTAEIAPLPPKAGTVILMTKELESIEGDAFAGRSAVVEKYRDEVAAPYEAAKRGYLDDIIPPEKTRKAIISALTVLSGKRVKNPDKKHINQPF